MFSGERASVTYHQICGPLDKLTISPDAVFALKVEADAHVNAAVSKVSVERTFILVFIHQLSNVPQVASQLYGGYRGVIPTFPFSRRARSKSGGARSRFAYVPHRLCFAVCVNARAWRMRDMFQPLDEPQSSVLHLS